MTTTSIEPFTDQDLTLVFAKELKRLAALAEKSCRNNDGIQMLSSLAAMSPIVKLLSETALTSVTTTQTASCESEPTNQWSDKGYL
jgi:hypothetical protein